ncbi:hypothetical protein [Arthrobacter alpinus]|nr:hypothetical protein [Arthrobacter alpinus]
MVKIHVLVGVLTGLTLVAITGCSSGSPEQEKLDASNYSSVKAKVDPVNLRITLPLTPYYVDNDEDVAIQTANATLLGPCMSAKGQQLDMSDAIPTPLPEDRRYGIWNKVNAENYGYELPPDPRHPSGPAGSASDGVPTGSQPTNLKSRDYGLAYTGCSKTLADKMLKDFTPNQVGTDSEVSKGLLAAASQAAGTDEWKAARTEWINCLSANGVSMPAGKPDSWVPVVSMTDKQSQIKTALTDIDCKEKTNYIKRLADIDATFQAAYIGQHESALNRIKADKDAAVEKAKHIIAEGK